MQNKAGKYRGDDGDSDEEGKEAAATLIWRDSFVRGKASTFQGSALGEEKNGDCVFLFPYRGLSCRGQHQLRTPPLSSSLSHSQIYLY